ncbi:MAG: hypothetical protein ACOYL3_12630 [Desulfuromonadaceae bacterium]
MGSSGQSSTARFLSSCLAVIMLLLTGGCSSINVMETWHKPVVEGHRYQKIMILGITRDENMRSTFENLAADELSKHQVVAVPANTIIPALNMDKTSRADIAAIVKASGCDAVLTTRAMKVGDSIVTQGGQSTYIYGVNAMSSHYDFKKATLQISMFDVTTEALVWSATVTTSEGDATAKVSRDLGTFFFESLRRNGLLLNTPSVISN